MDKIDKMNLVNFIIALFALCFGILGLVSCSASHSIDGSGKTIIVTTDTTFIYHSGALKTK